ncbi:MAG: hypothetical protein L0346_34350 [Chloroflexi bacterium]|nr:hypothetical protein [Chloroflexota bacterium]
MAKKRAKVSLDFGESVDLFAKTGPDERQEREKQRQRERLTRRATYDITPELKTAVERRATRLGIPASQLAMFFLCDALERYDAGEIDPEPYLEESTSPKFRNNLAFGEWYGLKGDIG